MTWSIRCLAYVLLTGNSPFSAVHEVADYRSLDQCINPLDLESEEFLQDVLVLDEDDILTPGSSSLGGLDVYGLILILLSSYNLVLCHDSNIYLLLRQLFFTFVF